MNDSCRIVITKSIWKCPRICSKTSIQWRSTKTIHEAFPDSACALATPDRPPLSTGLCLALHPSTPPIWHLQVCRRLHQERWRKRKWHSKIKTWGGKRNPAMSPRQRIVPNILKTTSLSGVSLKSTTNPTGPRGNRSGNLPDLTNSTKGLQNGQWANPTYTNRAHFLLPFWSTPLPNIPLKSHFVRNAFVIKNLEPGSATSTCIFTK